MNLESLKSSSQFGEVYPKFGGQFLHDLISVTGVKHARSVIQIEGCLLHPHAHTQF